MCRICDSWRDPDEQGSGTGHTTPAVAAVSSALHPQSGEQNGPHPAPSTGDADSHATTESLHPTGATAAEGSRSTAANFGDLTGVTAFRIRPGTVNRITDGDDHFRFTLTRTRSIFVSLLDLGANADLYLEDANGRTLARSTNDGTRFEVLLRTLSAGTYFIRVNANDSGHIDYRLWYVTHTQFSLGDLTGLTESRTRTGEVNTSDHEGDVFRFNVTRARTLWFDLTNLTRGGGDADIKVHDASGRLVWYSVFDGTVVDQIARTFQPGTYYLRVDADQKFEGTVRYRLRYGTDSGNGRTRASAFNLGDLTDLAVYRGRGETVGQSGNNRDFFRFTLSSARTIHFQIAGLTGNADLYLEDANGRTLASSTNGDTNFELLLRPLAAGTYYIRVDANDNKPVDYQLSYVTGTLQDLGDLTRLTNERSRTGTLSWHSKEGDAFRFRLTEVQTVYFNLRNLSAGTDADLGLFDSSGRRIGYSRYDGAAVDEISRTLQPGTYYVVADADSDGSIGYELRYGTQGGDGRTRGSAHDLHDLTNVTSFFGRSDVVTNRNYYRFTLTRARAVYFEATNLSANADLYLEDASGRTIASSTREGSSTDFVLRTLGAGTYFVRVDATGSGTIGYRLNYVAGQTHDLGNLAGLTSPRAWTGTVNRSSNERTAFRFSVSEARWVAFQLRNLNASADADLGLWNATGNLIASSRRDGADHDGIIRWLAPGTYYVHVDADSGGLIRYQLRYGIGRGDGRTRATAYDQGDITDLTAGRTFPGTVNRSNNDDDYFRFTLIARRTARIELQGLSADANLFLLNASGGRIASSQRSGTEAETIVRTLNAGTYFIQVDANASGTINYQLRYRTSMVGGTPAGGATREAAFSIGNLTGARSYRTNSGTVNHTRLGTVYRRFTLTSWRTMRFALRSLTRNADLYLEDEFGRVLQGSSRSGRAEETIVRELGPGTYYVRINARDSGDVGYQLRYRREPDPARGWTHQTAWYIGNLTDVAEYRTKIGKVNQRFDDADVRRFRLTETRTLRFELRNLTADADLYLEDANGQVVGRSVRSGTSTETVVRELGPGTWYVRVDANASGSIGYELRYRAEDAASRSAQSLWRDDAMAAAPAPGLEVRRHLASAGGMLSA